MKEVQGMLKKVYETCKNKDFIFLKENGIFQPKTFEMFVEDVTDVAQGLLERKLGDKTVLIYASNSYEWFVSWLAIIGYVGVALTIDSTWTSFSLNHIAQKLEIDAIIFDEGNPEIEKLKEVYPKIQYISIKQGIEECKEIGRKENLLKKDRFDFEKVGKEETCELKIDCALNLDMKIIPHTQKGMLANLEGFLKRVPLTEEDRIYVYLPFHESYTSIYTLLYALYTNAKVYLGEIESLENDLKIVKPTVFFGTPFIYKKLLENIDRNKMELKIKRVQKLQKMGIPIRFHKCFHSFYQLLGENIHYAISYGNFLDKSLKTFYKNMGIRIQNMYGNAETSSLISFEYADQKDKFSEGKILEGQIVRIDQADEVGYGEIIVKGENVTKCYYNNIAKTQEAFDLDGFFHTGDMGYIRENELFLVGKNSRNFVLENGKMVYPEKIEEILYNTNAFKTVNVFEKDQKIKLKGIINDKENIDKVIQEVNEKLPSDMKIQEYQLKE